RLMLLFLIFPLAVVQCELLLQPHCAVHHQPSLQLEPLTQAKRKKILDKHGDMRVMMGYELFSMWQKLGENKPHFTPG
ncbi:unnamed protein product, partial [Boreogadus saida]